MIWEKVINKLNECTSASFGLLLCHQSSLSFFCEFLDRHGSFLVSRDNLFFSSDFYLVDVTLRVHMFGFASVMRVFWERRQLNVTRVDKLRLVFVIRIILGVSIFHRKCSMMTRTHTRRIELSIFDLIISMNLALNQINNPITTMEHTSIHNEFTQCTSQFTQTNTAWTICYLSGVKNKFIINTMYTEHTRTHQRMHKQTSKQTLKKPIQMFAHAMTLFFVTIISFLASYNVRCDMRQ